MADARPAVFSHDNRVESAVYPHDVYALTDAGFAELRSGGTNLPPEALQVLVMLDGKRSVGDVEHKLPALAPEAVRNLLRSLLSAQLVRSATMAETDDLGVDFDAFFAAAGFPAEPSAGAQASAAREATSGAPALKRDGYYVSIARTAVKARAPRAGNQFAVLVIEDDPDVRTLVERLLGKAGFAVSSAVSREEITARLRDPAHQPDLILLDIGLPDVNGLELLQRLKGHAALKSIPVLMLTADSSPESIVRGLATGADGYITKPFDPAVLVHGVRAVLGA